jgi:hypothetical protein
MFSSSLVQNAQFLFIMQQDRDTHLRHTSKLLEPSVSPEQKSVSDVLSGLSRYCREGLESRSELP